MRIKKNSPTKRVAGWESLAGAICEQAVQDYMSDKISERVFKNFCLSNWFFTLYCFEGKTFFKRCKQEKNISHNFHKTIT